LIAFLTRSGASPPCAAAADCGRTLTAGGGGATSWRREAHPVTSNAITIAGVSEQNAGAMSGTQPAKHVPRTSLSGVGHGETAERREQVANIAADEKSE